MDLRFAEIACRQIKTKCTTFYETAKTKVKAFYRDVEKSEVFQNFMHSCKELREEARELWRSICSRRATESKSTSSIRGKYNLVPQESHESRAGYAEQIRDEAQLRTARKEKMLDKLEPIQVFESMAEMNESIEILQGKLVDQLSNATTKKDRKLVQKKMILLTNLAQFQKMRETTMEIDFKGLANDLFYSKTGKALAQRLDQKDVPLTVSGTLKAKLALVK